MVTAGPWNYVTVDDTPYMDYNARVSSWKMARAQMDHIVPGAGTPAGFPACAVTHVTQGSSFHDSHFPTLSPGYPWAGCSTVNPDTTSSGVSIGSAPNFGRVGWFNFNNTTSLLLPDKMEYSYSSTRASFRTSGTLDVEQLAYSSITPSPADENWIQYSWESPDGPVQHHRPATATLHFFNDYDATRGGGTVNVFAKLGTDNSSPTLPWTWDGSGWLSVGSFDFGTSGPGPVTFSLAGLGPPLIPYLYGNQEYVYFMFLPGSPSPGDPDPFTENEINNRYTFSDVKCGFTYEVPYRWVHVDNMQGSGPSLGISVVGYKPESAPYSGTGSNSIIESFRVSEGGVRTVLDSIPWPFAPYTGDNVIGVSYPNGIAGGEIRLGLSNPGSATTGQISVSRDGILTTSMGFPLAPLDKFKGGEGPTCIIRFSGAASGIDYKLYNTETVDISDTVTFNGGSGTYTDFISYQAVSGETIYQFRNVATNQSFYQRYQVDITTATLNAIGPLMEVPIPAIFASQAAQWELADSGDAWNVPGYLGVFTRASLVTAARNSLWFTLFNTETGSVVAQQELSRGISAGWDPQHSTRTSATFSLGASGYQITYTKQLPEVDWYTRGELWSRYVQRSVDVATGALGPEVFAFDSFDFSAPNTVHAHGGATTVKLELLHPIAPPLYGSYATESRYPLRVAVAAGTDDGSSLIQEYGWGLHFQAVSWLVICTGSRLHYRTSQHGTWKSVGKDDGETILKYKDPRDNTWKPVCGAGQPVYFNDPITKTWIPLCCEQDYVDPFA